MLLTHARLPRHHILHPRPTVPSHHQLSGSPPALFAYGSDSFDEGLVPFVKPLECGGCINVANSVPAGKKLRWPLRSARRTAAINFAPTRHRSCSRRRPLRTLGRTLGGDPGVLERADHRYEPPGLLRRHGPDVAESAWWITRCLRARPGRCSACRCLRRSTPASEAAALHHPS